MNNTRLLLRNKSVYFLGVLLFIITGILLLLFKGQSAAFISLHTYHPFWLNVFFINYTFIGDGIFACCLIAVYFLYFKKKQEGITLLYAFVLSSIAVQLIKNFISAPRPKLFFEPGQYLFCVEHVPLANNASFSSGHTACAFAIATVLMAAVKNKYWQLPILIAAIGVGYSRIYLAQHFLGDVLIGAIIGCSSGVIAVALANKKFRITLFNKRKLYFPEGNTVAYN